MGIGWNYTLPDSAFNASSSLFSGWWIKSSIKPGLHVRRKHKNKHKHKHKDVYTCDKHKHNVTYASTEANKFGAVAQASCLLARDLIPTWRKMATHE